MAHYAVVNYHITNRCNYHCTYCFGKFDNKTDPSPEEARKVIFSIASYFQENQISNGRINFAGGEPTLYPFLDELIDYTCALGISASIVTNGSTLTAERIRAWKGKVSCIGISIDSLDEETNLQIGRCSKGVVKTEAHWAELAAAMRECGIALKINTVVSQINLKETFLSLYSALAPNKIKLLQMHSISGINDQAKCYEITKQEFSEFCIRHNAFEKITVAEPCGSMENSYLMINPEGKVQLNNNGVYECFGNCCDTPLGEIMKSVPMDADRFNLRYDREVNQ